MYALEEEIISVKEENEDLKAALEPQQDRGLANVSRRQTLGLLGSGALLGGIGTASADSNGETPFADEDHDHSGDYLGEDNPVSAVRFEELYNAVGDAASRLPGTVWSFQWRPVWDRVPLSTRRRRRPFKTLSMRFR